MFTSSIQSNVVSNDCHQESNGVNQWWGMDIASCKTPSAPSSILRRCSGIIVKSRRSSLILQSLQFMLNCVLGFISARSGSCSNKLINADCQRDAVFLKARCAAGYQERYV